MSESNAEQSDRHSQNVEIVAAPTTVIRIASVLRRALEEVRAAPLDAAGRARIGALLQTCVAELQRCLDPTLHAELLRLAGSVEWNDDTSDGELRIAEAALMGWLEGLLEGIEATWSAQLAAAVRGQQRESRGVLPGLSRRSAELRTESKIGQYL